MNRTLRVTLAVAAAAALAVVAPALAQDAPAPIQTPPPAEAVGPPDPIELATRARILSDSIARAERTIERLGATGPLRAEIDDAARRQTELRALLAAMVGAEFVRLERLSRLRDQALLEDARLDALRTRLIDRLARLGELRGEWSDRQRLWRGWREAARGEPGFAEVEPEVGEAIERIEGVLGRASTSAAELLALQRRVEEVRADMEQIGLVVGAIRSVRRQALLERAEPVLLSRAHRSQLAEQRWRAWDPAATIRPAAYIAFLRGHLGSLAFYVLLAVVVGLVARRLRRSGTARHEWSGLLEHPWLLGVFVSAVLAMERITLAPPLWDVLLWALFGITAAILSRRLFQTRALRLTVYLLAAFYPAFMLLEVAQLPAPVFRLGLAVVAACAMPVFLVQGRRRAAAAAAAGSSDPFRIWPLRIGAAMWGVVLLAVLAGYDAFGRWILHSTVTSAAVVFVVVLAFALARGAATALAPLATGGGFLRRAGARLAPRLLVLLQVVLAVVAGLVLLDVWGVSESPVATWRRIIGAGFAAGTVRITVGRVLVGAVVIYVAVIASGLVRSLVTSDIERGQVLDRGVRESISRLVHYAVITLAAVLALAVMGVELQNFAIVAGALGIGVGFGLQNVVNNFASGLILLFERPVRVGDTVVVNDVWGTIQKIGLRSTVMVTMDQSEMIVPNADLVSEKVTNWTLSSPNARIKLPVGVAYGSPIAEVLTILVEAAFAHDAVLAEPPPEALFMEFGESSLDFELRIWVRDIRRRLQVRSAVLSEIERRFRDAGIEVPFPQRDLHLRTLDLKG